MKDMNDYFNDKDMMEIFTCINVRIERIKTLGFGGDYWMSKIDYLEKLKEKIVKFSNN